MEIIQGREAYFNALVRAAEIETWSKPSYRVVDRVAIDAYRTTRGDRAPCFDDPAISSTAEVAEQRDAKGTKGRRLHERTSCAKGDAPSATIARGVSARISALLRHEQARQVKIPKRVVHCPLNHHSRCGLWTEIQLAIADGSHYEIHDCVLIVAAVELAEHESIEG